MLLSDIQSATASYLNTTTSAFSINGQNLFLIAANNAIRNAQLRHNFEACRTVATLSISGTTGGSLDDATITQGFYGSVTISGAGSDIDGIWRLGGASRLAHAVYSRGSDDNDEVATLSWDGSNWILVSGGVAWVGPTTTTPAGSYVLAAHNTLTATVGTVFSGIKEVLTVSRVEDSNVRTVLDYTRLDLQRERDRSEMELEETTWWDQRYPSDAVRVIPRSIQQIVQRGRTLFMYPLPAPQQQNTASLSVELECQCWLRDFVTADLSDTSPTNFFCEFGHQWLMWACIIELNHRFKIFVPRTEGELAPPEKSLAQSWQDLLLWDSYQIDNNLTRSR